MNVLSIIGTVFNEMLIAVLSVVAFALLMREYVARKSRFLLFFSSAFAVHAVVMCALFLGHVFGAYGHVEAAVTVLRIGPALLVLEGYCIAVGAVDLLARKHQAILRAVAVILCLFGLVAVVTGPYERILVSGMTFVQYDASVLAVILGTWLYSSAMLSVLAAGRLLADRASKRQGSAPDRILLWAGVLGFMFVVASVVSTALGWGWLMPVSFLSLLADIALLMVGAAASDHPDPAVRKRPFTMYTKSLVFKAVALNALILWTLAVALLAITSSYFVSSSVDARHASLRRDLLYFAKSYSSYSQSLLEETTRFAAMPDVIKSVVATAGDDESMPAMVEEFMQKRRGARIIRVVDPDGVVRYSSYSPAEVGTHMLTSRVLEKALAGKKLAAVEKEEAFGVWTVRAGVPIKTEDGATVAVILDTDVQTAFDFSDYASVSPIYAAGYGFIAEDGEQVYTSGDAIDALMRSTLLKRLGAGANAEHRTDGALYLAQRVYATDGFPNGFFYIYLTNVMFEIEVFRIIAVVTVLVVLAVVFMTGILLFGMTVVLRPIRELRQAAHRVAKEERYDMRVGYRSPDELGQLAEAFNSMEATIADRTERLKVALREQQDFLDHTTRELRTPLNIFRWTLELMRFGDTGRLNKEQLELVEQLHQTNERLTKMVQNLQDAIRLDQRKLVLRVEDVSVEDVIDEVAGAFAVASRKKGIALHWNRPKVAMPRAYADRQYLSKVVGNLLGNAVKYTPQYGHIEIDLEEAEEASPGGKKGRFLTVTVEDNGIGIPKAEIARAFTKFFRASNVSESEIEGTGLGLFLAKEIVEMHGGSIWLESREGVGTKISFTVPTSRPDAWRQAPSKKA